MKPDWVSLSTGVGAWVSSTFELERVPADE